MDDKATSRFIIHYHGASRCLKQPVRLLLPGINGLVSCLKQLGRQF